MPFTSGTFAVYTPGTPYVTATTISSTVANSVNSDFATGLSTCLLKDGTQTVTANIPMSSFKITGLGAPTATGDALSEGAAIGGTTPAAIHGTTYNSSSGVTAVTASGAAVTLFNLASLAAGVFDVFAYLPNAGAVYLSWARYGYDGTNARLGTTDLGANMSLTLSGTSAQATQSSGSGQAITYTYLRIK